ncbi:Hypothetical protein SCF082_LOCUS4821 [Durusdinium trenchii]|uniref:Kinetochore protein Spc24 n=1 Tax=Durusdinium trenchii TaxID=1381693 RepID=A0ABP0I1Q5_9DINO
MADDETPPGPAARRASSRGSSLGLGAAGQVELKQKMVKLDGEFKGLRAQVTQIWKLLDSKGIAPRDEELRSAVSVLQRTEQEERQRNTRAFEGLREEMRRQKQEMQKQQHEMHQLTKELQRHAKELHLQSKLGLNRDKDLPMTVQAVSDDLFRFKRQIYDSGVLVPKLEVAEEQAPDPPVGALELAEDVYSARLLIRLGVMKAKKENEADLDWLPVASRSL